MGWQPPPPHHGPTLPSCPQGAVATGEDPTSVAIASIQSAATFPDPNIKYVFRTENGGTQVWGWGKGMWGEGLRG